MSALWLKMIFGEIFIKPFLLMQTMTFMTFSIQIAIIVSSILFLSSKAELFPEATLVSTSTVITHNMAPQGGKKKKKKKKNFFLYLGAHYVFKSKCSIQHNLLLSIGLRIIHCSFIHCHADSTSRLCHEHSGRIFYYQSNCTFHPDKSSLNLNYTHVVFYKHLHLGLSAL